MESNLYLLEARSKVLFDDMKVLTFIRASPAQYFTAIIIGTFAVVIGSIYLVQNVESIMDWSSNWSFLLSSFVFFYFVLYTLFSSTRTTMDFSTQTLLRVHFIGTFVWKHSSLTWPSDAYLKYENVFDSYQRVTDIWLLAASTQTKESIRLVRFRSEHSFKKFRELFNERFPGLPINEWHQ